jgi:hypothetical protein
MNNLTIFELSKWMKTSTLIILIFSILGIIGSLIASFTLGDLFNSNIVRDALEQQGNVPDNMIDILSNFGSGIGVFLLIIILIAALPYFFIFQSSKHFKAYGLIQDESSLILGLKKLKTGLTILVVFSILGLLVELISLF